MQNAASAVLEPEGPSEQLMQKTHKAQPTSGDAGKRLREAERRQETRRVADLERRLAETEELARSNRRELDLQFQRIAQMQADLDMLMKLARPGAATFRAREQEGDRDIENDDGRGT